MKKKGFTLVELLVVIAIIAMLLAILMPALGKVRQLAYRMMCGTNLKGLGTAMMVYSNENEESYPRSGGRSSTTLQWSDALSTSTSSLAWNSEESAITWSSVTDVTISSSWYLLIKYADVSAAQFVCQGSDEKKFEFNTTDVSNTRITDLTMLWDFGKPADNPYSHVSYCMQNPFFGYALSVSDPASKPIAADRNPWISTIVADNGKFLPEAPVGVGKTAGPQLLTGTGGDTTGADFWFKSTADNRKGASSQAHQGEGENVLFNDGHVNFEKSVLCGVESDNIYTTWNSATSTTEQDKQKGVLPSGTRSIKFSTSTPYTDTKLSKAANDSFLAL